MKNVSTSSFNSLSYVIFVFLLTRAPFSADTKNRLIPDFFDTKIHKIEDFHTKTHKSTFFDIGTAGGAGDKSQVCSLFLSFSSLFGFSPVVVSNFDKTREVFAPTAERS